MKKRMLTIVLTLLMATTLTACKPLTRGDASSIDVETTPTTTVTSIPEESTTTTAKSEITTTFTEATLDQTLVDVFSEKPADVEKNEAALPFELNTLLGVHLDEIVSTYKNVQLGETPRRWSNQYTMYGMTGEVSVTCDSENNRVNKVVFEGALASDFDKNALYSNPYNKEMLAFNIKKIMEAHIQKTGEEFYLIPTDNSEGGMIEYGSDEFYEYLQRNLDNVIEGVNVLLLFSTDGKTNVLICSSYPFHEVSLKFSVQNGSID